MTTRFPDERVDGFPDPPREITDGEGRDIQLREVSSADVEELVEMYLDFDPEDRAQGIPPTDEDGIREWLAVVTGEETLNVVACHEGDVVGHVVLVSDGDGAYELAIFVLQAYQGAHIGTELLRTVLGLGQREGIECVWLSVERWNTPAVKLYEKIGFERTDNASFELQMALRLASQTESTG